MAMQHGIPPPVSSAILAPARRSPGGRLLAPFGKCSFQHEPVACNLIINKLQMVRVEGIEPSSQAWEARILTTVLHPRLFMALNALYSLRRASLAFQGDTSSRPFVKLRDFSDRYHGVLFGASPFGSVNSTEGPETGPIHPQRQTVRL